MSDTTVSQPRSNRLLLLFGLIFWLANAAGHLAFSRLITSAIDTPLGTLVPIHYTRPIMLLVMMIVSGLLLARAQAAPRRLKTALCWGLLLLLMTGCTLLLMTTGVETIHFLQYGIISGLLALALDPGRRSWPLLEIALIALLLSVLDELNQYVYLTAVQGNYFDFNDLILNQLGVIAGLLFYYGFSDRPAPQPGGIPGLRRGLFYLYAVLLVICLLSFLTGFMAVSPSASVPPGGILQDGGGPTFYLQREPRLYGNSLPTFSSGLYYVVSPLQGLLALALLVAVCSTKLLHSFEKPVPA
ncbi:MAG: VanZ family protein [Halieaceae bacterium]